MKNPYPIQIIDKEDMSIVLPDERSFHLPIRKTTFGTLSADITCSFHKNGSQTILISKKVAEQLKFPFINAPLHVFVNEGTLFFGPLVGIFTAGFTPYQIRPIGERSVFFSKLLSVTREVGAYVFVFGEEHIDWEQGTVSGFFYCEDGWTTLEVPLPNVIYDRLPNRRTEKKGNLKKVKERLQTEYLIPWYNPGFFNKLDIFERLQQEDSIVKYLPETHPFTSLSIIERMLSDYGHIYIKPFNGSLGLGVHQIIYEKGENAYYCRYRHKDGENKLLRFKTLEALFARVFRKRNLSKMLVQQGIDLIRIDKRPVDFRIHTNKDHAGKWKVTAIAAKMASPGSVTTHIKNGGSIKTISELFETKEEQKVVVKNLTIACMELSEAIEKQMEGFIGEIGFDIGIDRNEHVWLFEANSKPGRSIFKHPHLREFDLLTRRLSLAFSIFLMEKSITSPEEIFT